MKTASRLLTHPTIQLVSFCLIIIGGQLFAAPYGWILRYALVSGEAFAIAGLIAVLVVLFSLFRFRTFLQLLALCLMWLSLILFYIQTKPEARNYMFGTAITMVTLLLFVVISMLTIAKLKKWKNY